MAHFESPSISEHTQRRPELYGEQAMFKRVRNAAVLLVIATTSSCCTAALLTLIPDPTAID